MKIVEELIKKGFNGADIHWFHSYYEIGIVVRHHNEVIEILHQEKRDKNKKAMELMLTNGTLKDIKEVIRKGKIGLTNN